MEYLKINGTDFSNIVNELKVSKSVNYSAQTNAEGNTVVDYINAKRVISVGFIPLDGAKMAKLLAEIDAFSVSLSFHNPLTNAVEENVQCIAPKSEPEYYTIQAGRVLYKALSIEFTEL
jgi:hypothetical protein